MKGGGRKVEHADALELIGYGLAKFAGPKKGKNEIANYMAGNRSAFFQKLVDLGIASSKNAVSNRQDGYDPFFGTKKGYIVEPKIKIYKPRKARLDAVIGHLNMLQFASFIDSIIKNEQGQKISIDDLQLINKAKQALTSLDSAENASQEQNRINEANDGFSPDVNNEEDVKDEKEVRQHIEVQWKLKQLGFLAGCDVFIAKNDQNQVYKGEVLDQGCIKELPRQGMTANAYKRISLIDVVWVKKNRVVCAFEVECSTSIYSGILRISDLAYSMPYNPIRGYIIAPENRIKKVVEELERPTFSNDRIQGLIRYMTIEELYDLYNPLEKMNLGPGAVTPDLLEQKAHVAHGEI